MADLVEGGALRCAACGAAARVLFRVTGQPRPICQRCASRIIRGEQLPATGSR